MESEPINADHHWHGSIHYLYHHKLFAESHVAFHRVVKALLMRSAAVGYVSADAEGEAGVDPAIGGFARF